MLCLLVCKFKTHKRCVVRVSTQCKWTCLASMGKDILEDDGVNLDNSLYSMHI